MSGKSYCIATAPAPDSSSSPASHPVRANSAASPRRAPLRDHGVEPESLQSKVRAELQGMDAEQLAQLAARSGEFDVYLQKWLAQTVMGTRYLAARERTRTLAQENSDLYEVRAAPRCRCRAGAQPLSEDFCVSFIACTTLQRAAYAPDVT